MAVGETVVSVVVEMNAQTATALTPHALASIAAMMAAVGLVAIAPAVRTVTLDSAFSSLATTRSVEVMVVKERVECAQEFRTHVFKAIVCVSLIAAARSAGLTDAVELVGHVTDSRRSVLRGSVFANQLAQRSNAARMAVAMFVAIAPTERIVILSDSATPHSQESTMVT
jgi:hypothetical protein